MSKISYATYIKDRLTGFRRRHAARAGAGPGRVSAHPQAAGGERRDGEVPRPRCVGEIRVRSLQPARDGRAEHEGGDVRRRADGSVSECGIAGRHRAVPAERSLQVAGRLSRSRRRSDARGIRAHRRRRACSCRSTRRISRWAGTRCIATAAVEEFLNRAAQHIEVLNHALRNVPADRVRMHVCWGNYEGPHHHDVPLERLLPVLVARAGCSGLLIEGANPRHAHEWAVFRDFQRARGQDPDSGRDQLDDELHRAPAAGRGAHRPIRGPGRPRARDRRQRLRLRHVRRLRPGRSGCRVSQAAIPGRGRRDRIATGCGAGIDRMPMRIDQFIEVRGARLRVRTAGRGPAVLAHSWLDARSRHVDAAVRHAREPLPADCIRPPRLRHCRRARPASSTTSLTSSSCSRSWRSSGSRSSACRRARASRCAGRCRLRDRTTCLVLDGPPRDRLAVGRRRGRFRSRPIASWFAARASMHSAGSGWSIRSCACTRMMCARAALLREMVGRYPGHDLLADDAEQLSGVGRSAISSTCPP